MQRTGQGRAGEQRRGEGEGEVRYGEVRGGKVIIERSLSKTYQHFFGQSQLGAFLSRMSQQTFRWVSP